MELSRKVMKRRSERGMSLIELMIASLVLMIGVLGCAALIPISIGTNSRNKQQSNSTVIAQMLSEKILSAAAVGSTTVALSDCTATSTTINVTGTAGGTGATVLSSGSIDFSAAQGSSGAPAGYYMNYTSCGTAGRVSTYDVRWNVKTPSSYVKLVTVSAKLKGSGTNAVLFSLPVTIRSMVGGS
ncbi:MAG: prepilin-type N-terminal cleavage/methylation domain-containing protein [Acidobacteriota bacterium]|nr:prepilin-type N-terminal cleavage/methylation domain-containing protein [Acidobacteriota bacterium]